MLIDTLKPFLRTARTAIYGTLYRGTAKFCPVCEQGCSKFLGAGVKLRAGAACPHCGARERHRLVWAYLNRKTDLFDGRKKTMLHVAPEACLKQRLADRLKDGYLTADLLDPYVAVKMDITKIQYPDESFDVIYCSHVLEHVPDDRLAMREFHRVLSSKGWALLLVPITAETTYEDPTITTPREREKAFGQSDHVRRYGPDYIDRLRESGFHVDKIVPQDFLTTEEIEYMGVQENTGEIYRCTKSS